MIIFKKFDDYKKYIKMLIPHGKRFGFIPTMGALHQGHLSLIEKSKQDCDITISSIYINPTQFNNPEDYKNYPVTIEKDIYLLEKNECDILLLPDMYEVYPKDFKSTDIVLDTMETTLEGKFRPGHFRGVCQVIERLLHVVSPDHLYMGQKDYQQCMVVKKLIEQINANVELKIEPTVRESNGLAMSSRNLRLTDEEKNKAANIFKSLLLIKNNMHKGNIQPVKMMAETALNNSGLKTDYVQIAKLKDLTIVDDWDGDTALIALIAATINNIRLIDNLPLQ